jgi:hypothetical protein
MLRRLNQQDYQLIKFERMPILKKHKTEDRSLTAESVPALHKRHLKAIQLCSNLD